MLTIKQQQHSSLLSFVQELIYFVVRHSDVITQSVNCLTSSWNRCSLTVVFMLSHVFNHFQQIILQVVRRNDPYPYFCWSIGSLRFHCRPHPHLKVNFSPSTCAPFSLFPTQYVNFQIAVQFIRTGERENKSEQHLGTDNSLLC